MRRAAEEDPEHTGKNAWTECPTCRTKHGEDCPICGGMGWVALAEEEPPEDFDDLAEFLRAWAMIERYGLGDWMLAAGVGELPDQFMDALAILNGELDRLEHEERKARAVDQRRKNKGAARGN